MWKKDQNIPVLIWADKNTTLWVENGYWPTFGNKGLPINNDVQGSSAYVANGMPTAAELLKQK